jgi:CubicO group peptidase (beta-lactamase class C family)
MTKRTARVLTASVVLALTIVGAAHSTASAGDGPSGATGSPASAPKAGEVSVDRAQAAAVMRIVRAAMKEDHLKAVIVRVTVDGKNLVTRAAGESMTGVPATTAMHFRNGAVAIGYMANLLLQLVDEGTVSLDDKVSKWLPRLPHADKVTVEQLARMTSGYHDYVHSPAFIEGVYANPFRQWTTLEKLALGVNEPLWYEPGTNWNYAHTNYVILGLIMERATGRPLGQLLRAGAGAARAQQRWDGPPRIPEPVLHAFSSERREFLGIPEGTSFYEESSFWNPSWTIADGSIQTTNIYDLNTSAIALGTGALLSPESGRAMISTDLRGFGGPEGSCENQCHQQWVKYSYGIGAVTTGNWVMQNPLFGGYSAVEAYLPSKKIAIAVAVTYAEDGFAPDGSPTNQADTLFRAIGAQLAPDDAPPQ